MTRKQAIRAKCIECCNGVKSEVRLCPVVKCPLWKFRMGRVVDADAEQEE